MPLPVETEQSRHPFELFILTCTTLLGISIVTGGEAPKSIAALSGSAGHATVIWGYLLAGGSLVSLVGSYWRGRLTSLLLVQVGMVALGTSALMYAVAVLIAAGTGGLLPATLIAWFGVNALRRWAQIERELHAAGRKARDDGGR